LETRIFGLEVSMAQEDKLIDYLSKEIETQTKNLMSFRERINFAIFIGPFVLLGATLYGKGLPHVKWSEMGSGAWSGLAVSFLGVILSYLTMGIACSLIEVHIWGQCNRWRERISEISRGHIDGFEPKELWFDERLRRGYLWVYGAMIVAFASAIIFVVIIQTHT
jgi:hypothetical protein